MKIFIYKFLISCFLIFILYQVTLGYTLRNIEIKVQNYFSKEKINYIKEKVRDEIEKGVQKERILSKEDSILVNTFLKKVIKELNEEN